MNGNNKDDPQAISGFIERMEVGYDYVRGSRFLGAGDCVNTPLIRRWPIRFLHAPLFSFGVRRWMTDTTNVSERVKFQFAEAMRQGPLSKLCRRADTKVQLGTGHLLLRKPLIELILGRYR